MEGMGERKVKVGRRNCLVSSSRLCSLNKYNIHHIFFHASISTTKSPGPTFSPAFKWIAFTVPPIGASTLISYKWKFNLKN
jgi:hypothetical protein